MKPCNEHSGCSNRKGYGVVRHNGKAQLSHRVAYCEFHRLNIEAIKGKVIRHRCDNPRCVEPTHLLIGTQADNVRDMHERGRNMPPPHRLGERHSMAKLTYSDVKSIRAEHCNGVKQVALARKYGVTPTNISYIVRNMIWNEGLCEINAHIAPMSISAEGLAKLGFAAVGTNRDAKLYRESDLHRIYHAMIDHLRSVLEVA